VNANWTLEYDSEVIAHLYLLREDGVAIRQAVRSLAKGIPAEARQIQDDPETWEWLEARHWITFVIDRGKQWIYVSGVESATIE